jgi:anti-sigma factor ChrR (cupin superfamily)
MEDRGWNMGDGAKPTGQGDPANLQAQMHAGRAGGASAIVKLIFADLLAAATDGALRWETLRPGVEIARLCTTEGGPSSALLRYAPGAKLARHEHVGFEHIFVLAGSQTDDSGEHHAGALLIHGPGTSHAIASKRGCIVLAVWEKPVRFLV